MLFVVAEFMNSDNSEEVNTRENGHHEKSEEEGNTPGHHGQDKDPES